MDVEFHYYMTYLVAAKAGLGTREAFKIAYASQYVDDNRRVLEVDAGLPSAYRNYISQTLDILRPRAKLFRIYPLFHFIPGDPMHAAARRRDGKMHWLNTTPGSENAHRILGAALETGDACRIGIACHAFADTWAHQNFVGYADSFNALGGAWSRLVPDIGHADAQCRPDWPALVWRDTRVLASHERRDNRRIFLKAAEALFTRLLAFGHARASPAAQVKLARELCNDLSDAIGDRDPSNSGQAERIARYRALSAAAPYGGSALCAYDPDAWAGAALKTEVRGFRDRSDFALARWDPLADVVSWSDRERYRDTDWYRFQEAVKAHQDAAWGVLGERNFKGLELPEL